MDEGAGARGYSRGGDLFHAREGATAMAAAVFGARATGEWRLDDF